MRHPNIFGNGVKACWVNTSETKASDVYRGSEPFNKSRRDDTNDVGAGDRRPGYLFCVEEVVLGGIRPNQFFR